MSFFNELRNLPSKSRRTERSAAEEESILAEARAIQDRRDAEQEVARLHAAVKSAGDGCIQVWDTQNHRYVELYLPSACILQDITELALSRVQKPRIRETYHARGRSI